MDPMDLSAIWGSLFPTTPVAPPMPIPPTLQPGAPNMAPMMPRPIEPYMTDPLVPGYSGGPSPPMSQQSASLGAMLDPTVPLPRPRPAEAPGGTYAAQIGSGVNDPSKMFAALKGVIAPPPPVAQKVSTPHAPQMAKLQGGNVAELLASLGIGPQQAFPGLKLPSTLGQALVGGR